MVAYQFWYIFNEGDKTEYVWIISDSVANAKALYRSLYSGMFDYDTNPCDSIPESEFERPHTINSVLSGDAII